MAQDAVINGTTYPAVEAVALTDGNGNVTQYYPDAVRYVGQALTEAQKAQARENIGAKNLNWRGEWNDSETYDPNDAVRYNGSAYIAVSNETIPTGISPDDDPDSWQLLVRKGDTGPAGADGATVEKVLQAMSRETWVFTLSDGTTIEKVVPLL